MIHDKELVIRVANLSDFNLLMTAQLKNQCLVDCKIIAKNVSKLMESHNISESNLAKELGVSVMTIRRVMSGETEDPRISTLSLIADYFKITLDSLCVENAMPIKFTKNKKTIFIPIFEWEKLDSLLKGDTDLSTWKEWYPVINTSSLNLRHNSFAIESKRSMQPKFPLGSLIIINPDEPPSDNDIVLIKMLDTKEFSLRELLIDSPKWILLPTVKGSEPLFYSKEKLCIIGVVVLTILQKKS